MSESSNAKPPRITKSVFNSILKQQQEAEANPKAKKEKKEGEEGATKKKEKKRKANRNFQVLVTDEEEYKSLIDRMEHSIKRTTDCPVGLVGNRYASFDPITGQPCLYFVLGIPHQRVGEKRNKGIAPNSDDCYLPVYGFTVRFVHGHQFRFGGGVGGVTIPLIKWLNIQNNNIMADYTVMGHWHQYFSGKNFICNGSLIGFNAFGKKFGYEPPKQAFFLIDSRFGKTVEAPILLEQV